MGIGIVDDKTERFLLFGCLLHDNLSLVRVGLNACGFAKVSTFEGSMIDMVFNKAFRIDMCFSQKTGIVASFFKVGGHRFKILKQREFMGCESEVTCLARV